MAFIVIGNELAEKLRREDPEQFHTLVRMHLSFVLDLNTDDGDYPGKTKFRPSKWVFGKKTKCLGKGVMEGAPLTQEGICQAYQLIEFLTKESNICQEGLFRRTGHLKRQQELKALLNSGVPVNLDEGLFSVHDCASVLKNFLAELPEPLLTDAHYPIYCQIAEFCGPSSTTVEQSEVRLLHSLQLLLLLLPTENRILLRDVLKLLNLAASYEHSNKMSAESLSMMFTPHLLCPRKLTPEAFHANSQAMSGIVAFMIHKGDVLFEIPPKLATDIKVYWAERERRNASGLKDTKQRVCLVQDERVVDGAAANTVFTFVDRERTTQENLSNPTEAALAQLYAHIQSLPESSKKRRLIKQFNKENGQGTPLQFSRQKNHHRSKSLGDSIKKHIFNKSLKRAKAANETKGLCTLRSLSQDELNSPLTPGSKSKFFHASVEGGELGSKVLDPISDLPALKQSLCDSNSAVIRLRHSRRSSRPSITNRLIFTQNNDSTCEEANFSIRRAILHNLESQVAGNRSPGSPYCLLNRSPALVEGKQGRSLIQNPGEAHNLQENMLCPSQEVEGSNTPSSKCRLISDCPAKSESSPSLAPHTSLHAPRNQDTDVASVSNSPITHLQPCRLFTDSPVVLPGAFSACNSSTTNRLTPPQKDQINCLITSTPASQHFARKSNGVVGPYDVKQTSLNHSFLTPDENNSMSPITRSTQRMSKAMQETMMTPRSRKPVVVLSGSNICHLANVSAWQKQTSNILGNGKGSTDDKSEGFLCDVQQGQNASCQEQMPSSIEQSHSDCSLTCPFKSYLLSRSVVTASPVDLSFSSRTGDFDTSLSRDRCLSGDMNESLLYCLDGHDPLCSSGSEKSEVNERGVENVDCNKDTAAKEILEAEDLQAKILNFTSSRGAVRETSL